MLIHYCLLLAGVNTHLGREHDEETAAAIEKTSSYWKTPDEGASTSLVAALDPKLNGKKSAIAWQTFPPPPIHFKLQVELR